MSGPLDGGSSFSEYVEQLGGHANAETGLERMLFYAQVRPDDIDDVVVKLGRSIFTPELTEGLLARERAVVLQELASAAADPSDVVQDAILGSLFPGHPLGRPVGGVTEEIRRTELAEVARHHAYSFLARPMVLVVLAPSRPEIGYFECDLPQLEADSPVPMRAVSQIIPRWPDEYSWTCLGARSPSRLSGDQFAYQILATLLGSSPASLLYRRLRSERGLAYSFHTWVRGYAEAGAWRFLAGVDQGNGESVIETVRSTLTDVARHGVRDDDLRAAQRQAEVRLAITMDNPLEMAKQIAARTVDLDRAWSPDTELVSLHTVSAGDVSAAAEHVLANLVAVVRPEP